MRHTKLHKLKHKSVFQLSECEQNFIKIDSSLFNFNCFSLSLIALLTFNS